jgi:hypothetical protein
LFTLMHHYNTIIDIINLIHIITLVGYDKVCMDKMSPQSLRMVTNECAHT